VVAREQSGALSRFGLDEDGFVVATVHRQANTEEDDRLRAILRALDGAAAPVVLPAHPRTREAAARIDFEAEGSLALVEPLGYLDFLRLLDAAAIAVTDSGGVQEEASVLETPCLTVRPNTERPETVAAAVNELVEPAALSGRLATLLSDETARTAMTGHPDLYGDGDAGERTVTALVEVL
jgi:UDP-N-acetylglucosamine 2-epimerase (non-hydrolysing)